MKRALVMVGVMVFSSPWLWLIPTRLWGAAGVTTAVLLLRPQLQRSTRVQAGILQGALQDRAQTEARNGEYKEATNCKGYRIGRLSSAALLPLYRKLQDLW